MKISTLLVLLPLCIAPVRGAHAEAEGSKFTTALGYKLDAGIDLESIAGQLGPSPIITSGDAAGFEARLCYLLPAGSLSFLSGELDGSSEPGKHYLGGFELSQTASADCKTLRDPLKAALDIGGLHLGMSRAEFEATAGGPVVWKGDKAERLFESKVMMPPRDTDRLKSQSDDPRYYDMSVSLDATFVSDRLVDLTVWKTATN